MDEQDLKLIDDKAKKIIAEFKDKLSTTDNINKEVLEAIINGLIKKMKQIRILTTCCFK